MSQIEFTELVADGRAELRVLKVLTPFDFVPLDRSSTLIPEAIGEKRTGPALRLNKLCGVKTRAVCAALKTGR